MIVSFYRKFNQGIIVAGCAMTSFVTLGWMMLDVHRLEKKELINKYESKISNYEKEINNLKKNRIE